jgi:hypothetical protein
MKVFGHDILVNPDPSSMSPHELTPYLVKNKTQPFLFPPFNGDINFVKPCRQEERVMGTVLEMDLDRST